MRPPSSNLLCLSTKRKSRSMLKYFTGLALAAQVSSDSLDNVEHVIIFMQENRAFDHYFGSLKGVRGFNDRNTQPMASGLPNSFYQPVDQEDLSQYMLPFHVDAHSTSAMCMDAPQMGYESDLRKTSSN